MVKYPIFYRKYGCLFLNDFKTPEVLDESTFMFPFYSVLFFNKLMDNMVFVSRNLPILNNFNFEQQRLFLHTSTEYVTEPLGKIRLLKDKINPYKQEQKKLEFKIRNMEEADEYPDVTKKDLIVYNTSNISNFHKYDHDNQNPYYRYLNSIKTQITLASHFSDPKRPVHKFLYIELPHAVPTYTDCRRIAKLPKFQPMFLKTITHYSFFNLLELFKLLTPEFREQSVFSLIPEEQWEDTNLLLVQEGKLIVVNFKVLLGLVKEYNIKVDRVISLPSKTVVDILFHITAQLVTETPVGMEYDAEEVSESEADTQPEVTTPNDTKPKHPKVTKNVLTAVKRDKVVKRKSKTTDMNTEKESDLDFSEKTREEVTLSLQDQATKALKEQEDADVTDTVIVEDDDLFTEEETTIKPLNYNVDNVNELNKIRSNSLEDTLNNNSAIVDSYLEEGSVNKNQADTIKKLITEQWDMPISYLDNQPVKEILDINKDNYLVSEEEIEIQDCNLVFDKGSNKNVIAKLDEKYIKTQLKKDIFRTFYSVSKRGHVLKSHTVVDDKSMMGDFEIHKLEYVNLKGKSIKIDIKLPKVSPDGTYEYGGIKYVLRKQHADIPILKINPRRVALSSFYAKTFVEKARVKKNDFGYWLRQQLFQNAEGDKNLKNIVAVDGVEIDDIRVPKDYGILARFILNFTHNNITYHFEPSSREKHRLKYNRTDNLEALEQKMDGILVGCDKNTDYFLREDNKIYANDKEQRCLGDFYTLLGINKDYGPIESPTIRVGDKHLPVGLLLIHYVGLKQVLKILRVEYEEVNKVNALPVADDQFAIRFTDHSYIINRDYDLGDMVLGFVTEYPKVFRQFTKDELEDRVHTGKVLTSLGLTIKDIQQIDMLETSFVDPMTETTLRELKLPLTFVGLLFKACEYLTDDNHTSPKHADNSVIKGYERIPGMLYKELYQLLRTHENKARFTESKLQISPHQIFTSIQKDNTVSLIDDINPIAEMKLHQQVTFLGAFGRKKDTMSQRTRVIHKTSIGIASEASPDSSDIGINYYLTATPNLDSTKGVKGTRDIGNEGYAPYMSTTGMLVPFSTKDSPKRVNFTNIQSSHTIPMVDMKLPHILTGHEAIIPIHSSRDFCIPAEHKGKVLKVTPTQITVQYLPNLKAKRVAYILEPDNEYYHPAFKVFLGGLNNLLKEYHFEPKTLPNKTDLDKLARCNDTDILIGFHNAFNRWKSYKTLVKTNAEIVIFGQEELGADHNILKSTSKLLDQNKKIIPDNDLKLHWTLDVQTRKEIEKVLKVYDLKPITKSYDLKTWHTKEVSGTCFTYSLITALKAGDTFEKDDTLAYEKNFYHYSMFNNRRVCFTQGSVVNVALMEVNECFEDACSISQSLCKRFSSIETKVVELTFNVKDKVSHICNVGDKVEPGEILITVLDEAMADFDTKSDDPNVKKLLASLKFNNITSKYKGTIKDIQAIYHAERSEMSASMRKVVDEADERTLKSKGYTGKIGMGFSVKGKPVNQGEIVLKILIERDNDFGIGDKGVLAGQLKFIVGEIRNYKMVTEETNEEIEVIFSTKGILARVVNSAIIIGSTAKLLDVIKDQAVDLYFGKK